ncbi:MULTISPECIES: 16S rRNA (adenine(1518)-N(6)/adenine(1519)-N(6))-dimethyltransferase RsmA [unclassified Ketobacter]|uniref:16S rRNA (adenine(1518)-N(6)/adenine(1519)-N(6))- dimethyltransferase RsmA n=1 Tax=unclassified Ketobacter TaxID=2639109 RepID=UPI000F0D755D|nr:MULTISPECIES: 16S rRNA (adenine(1518)-N(6)/adenine(1519)-N(6))-dimethyltransferase RsmA [unclassified Ketobacter]MCK5791328.1 16S rRNA (adenine(1518)-N(6)/adenine(1519)-N(6))-dimethyltransferase RsmA [Ketobacter sp.]MEC8812084.1 16S rRNA (adenine(1518)-N(6)/adenine(1519)-N(6))-dimethyltransferase RsmA [Pseudomonadota bacterium]RLT87561.1 MAG: 16S rRNA (adenine(1518)-N(6)/adenine(1519)-N(6))-dimethyltransferase RsmA [Ketobacter sp. GenoA1]RLT93297.1 MAG: 16S rRNA (adenine(1518)-N(6)/adenine(1
MAKGRKPGFSKHQPRKRFGQNFLQDPGVIDNIIQCIAPQTEDLMVEIGPGLGALTEHLIDQVGQLAVVELDRDLIPNLRISFATRNNFHIYEGDALKFNYGRIIDDLGEQKMRIVGNLPYNISTPLLFHLIDYHDHIHDMHFMLQKEVVDRMAAGVGDSAYGRLSIMIQYYCQVSPLFQVPPTAFNPPPKVDSAIVRLVPHTTLPVTTRCTSSLNKIVTAAFNQRRKTIRNALKSYADDALLEEAGIRPEVRPEQVSLAQYAHLTDLTLLRDG